jgi:pilus assembly protein CpaB
MISLGASAALGLGALVVARVWLPAQTPRTQTVAAAAQPAPGVPVVVASGAIGFGTRLEARNLRIASLPASAAPAGHFSTIAQVINQQGGAPVALAQIAQNEPILPSRISGPGARPTLSAEIREGMRAYTIGITNVLGGGGHILPGDRVDVMLARAVDAEQESSGRVFVANVVVQDVRVLGMDLNADPTSDRPAVASTATLEVTLQDSVRLALAAQAGTLSLALRRNGSNEIVAQRPVVLVNGAGGSRRPAREPDAAQAQRPAAAPARPATDPNQRQLIVSSGATHTTVSVPAGN